MANQDPDTSLYQYSPFKSEREIRLLQLEPGTDSDEIQCSIIVVDLDSKPVYNALSYVWGATEKLRHVRISGEKLLVTENLFNALKRFRNEDVLKIMWIDAICIDQTNDSERSHQVQMMTSIYSTAVEVLIWLGEEEERVALVFDLVRKFSAAKLPPVDEAWTCVDEVQDPSVYFDLLAPVASPVWAALREFLARPWFTRVWVIQEAAVAASCTGFCGSLQISWEDLVNFSKYLFKSKLFSLFGIERSDALRPLTSSIVKGSNSGFFDGSIDLMGLLVVTNHYCATEPKDSVFALMGIASLYPPSSTDDSLSERSDTEWSDYENSDAEDNEPEPSDNDEGENDDSNNSDAVSTRSIVTEPNLSAKYDSIKIDYSLSIEQVLTQVSRYLLIEEETATILTYACLSQNPLLRLPSWVVDWTHPFVEYEMIPLQAMHFEATGDTTSNMMIGTDESILVIEGILIGSVERIGTMHKDSTSYEPNITVLNYWKTRLAEITQFFHDCDLLVTAKTTHSNFPTQYWRTLICDVVQLSQKPEPELEAGYHQLRRMLEAKTWQKTNTTLQDLMLELAVGELRNYLAALQCTTKGKVICAASTGGFGWAPGRCLVGDLVCLFKGVSVPYVLRPCGEGFRMVGEMYLDGFMDGEVLERDDLEWEMLKIM
jgi:hypothetical protein